MICYFYYYVDLIFPGVRKNLSSIDVFELCTALTYVWLGKGGLATSVPTLNTSGSESFTRWLVKGCEGCKGSEGCKGCDDSVN